MFGKPDPATGLWQDGFFTYLWRQANAQPPATDAHGPTAPTASRTPSPADPDGRPGEPYQWITCDGPMEADAVQRIADGVTGSQALRLANGEALPMAPRARVLFEVEDLKDLTPRVTSVAGIVCFAEMAWEDRLQVLTPTPAPSLALTPTPCLHS